jgi:hypothetical protein
LAEDEVEALRSAAAARESELVATISELEDAHLEAAAEAERRVEAAAGRAHAQEARLRQVRAAWPAGRRRAEGLPLLCRSFHGQRRWCEDLMFSSTPGNPPPGWDDLDKVPVLPCHTQELAAAQARLQEAEAEAAAARQVGCGMRRHRSSLQNSAASPSLSFANRPPPL